MSEQFDRGQPGTKFIAVFGAVTLVALVAIILGLQAYTDRVEQQELFVKVLQPVSDDLLALRAKEDAELNSYGYIDRAKGKVRLPIRRAMELLVKEKGK